MSRALRIAGPAGRLEALLDEPEAAAARGAGAVVAHPHPLRGGTMHNTIVYRTAKALAAAGFETIRFNFRGVGASEGEHDEGRGEQEDYRAALDAVAARLGASPGARLLACGYSFGAVAALRASGADPRVAALAAIGLPVTLLDADDVRRLEKPLLVVQGEQDPFGTPAQVSEIKPAGGRVEAIAGAGHFFEGKEAEVAAAVVRFATAEIA